METALQAETESLDASQQLSGGDDGLAGSLATEHGAESHAAASHDAGTGTAKRIGRPPTHGRYSKAAGSDGKNAVPLPGESQLDPAQMDSGAEPRVVIPPDLLSKVLGEAVTLCENVAQYKLRGAAKLAGLSEEDIDPQLKAAQIGETRKALIGELAPLAMQEWGMDPEMSPTGAIGLLMVPWLLNAGTAYWTLAKLAVERNERRVSGSSNKESRGPTESQGAAYRGIPLPPPNPQNPT